MKKVIVFLSSLMLLASVGAQTIVWNSTENAFGTNFLATATNPPSPIFPYSPGPFIWTRPDSIRMYSGTNQLAAYETEGFQITADSGTVPDMEIGVDTSESRWIVYAPTNIAVTTTLSARDYGNPVVGGSKWNWNFINGDVVIYSNLWVEGSINSFSNYVVISNSVAYTNVTYYTNSQAATVDMTKPYGDLQTAGALAFTGFENTTFSLVAYQTAVVIVRNTYGTNNAITFPANCHVTGSAFVTNETVCTFFYNPNSGRTNVVVLPLW